jgi:hypothetical protein
MNIGGENALFKTTLRIIINFFLVWQIDFQHLLSHLEYNNVIVPCNQSDSSTIPHILSILFKITPNRTYYQSILISLFIATLLNKMLIREWNKQVPKLCLKLI